MGRKNRKINRALRVTRARVAGLAMDAQRTQATLNHSLALANRAVNETKALVTKHALHDDEITRTHAALAAINKEQDVQRVAHTLLDAAIGQIMADVKELRADVVRLSDLVAPLNEEVVLLRRYMGARIEGDQYAGAVTAKDVEAALRHIPSLLRGVGTGPDGTTVTGTIVDGDFVPDEYADRTTPDTADVHIATVTNMWAEGGVDVPIPTYTTPSEVCAPPPTDLIPIQVAVGALDPEVHFDIDRVKEAIVSILDRPEWRRDEGAYEYATTANGYRVTITHTNGAVLTDNDIHDTLWKVLGTPDQEEN